MSFSRRYAKERSHGSENIAAEVSREEEGAPRISDPQTDMPLEADAPELEDVQDELIVSPKKSINAKDPPKRKLQFSGRFKDRSEREQIEEQFKRRYTHQASRLSYLKAEEVEESDSFPWKKIFYGLIFIALLLSSVIGWRHRDSWIFPIKHIELKGDFQRVDPMGLQAVLAHYASGSLLFFSAGELKDRLQDLPWVDQVNLKRQWPTTLMIVLNEKHAVARFGDNQLLAADGVVFSAPNMEGMEKLPYINGPANLSPQLWTAYQALNNLLAPYQLTIWRMDVSPRLAYTLVLSDGVTLYLGSTNVVDRLKIFGKVYEKNLKARADQMQYADMRYSSGMAVGWKLDKPSSGISVGQASSNLAR